MTKKTKTSGLLLFVLFIAAAQLFAQETTLTESKASLYKLAIIVSGAVITLAAAAGAFCQAKALSAACEGISRNPQAAPHIRFLLLLGLILIETLVIYALLVTFIILMGKWKGGF